MSGRRHGERGGDGGPEGEGQISCEEALARLYEYLDGELEPETQEQVHRHLEVCKRCYPFFNFERIFLDYLRDRGLAPEENPRLRRKIKELLERDG